MHVSSVKNHGMEKTFVMMVRWQAYGVSSSGKMSESVPTANQELKRMEVVLIWFVGDVI